MPEVKLTAELRTEFGKGAARRIRRAHKVPAVLYGHGTDPIHISLPGHETLLALRTANALLSIDIDGTPSWRCPSRCSAIRSGTPSSTSTWSSCGAARRSPSTSRILLEGEAAPGDPGRGRPEQRADRGRGHPHPDPDRRLDRGAAGRHPDPGQGPEAAGRLPRSRIDPDALIVNITAAQSSRAAEAELAEAEAEAGIEPTVAEPTEDEQPARGSRSRRTPSSLACVALADVAPGWWSGSATRARRTPGTGTTSASCVVEELARPDGHPVHRARGMRAEIAESRLGPAWTDRCPG